MSRKWLTAVLFALALMGLGAAILAAQIDKKTTAGAFRDDFKVDKNILEDKGSNTYMILEPGWRLVLADGRDTLTITVLAETKVVDGVKNRIVEERETKGDRRFEVVVRPDGSKVKD